MNRADDPVAPRQNIMIRAAAMSRLRRGALLSGVRGHAVGPRHGFVTGAGGMALVLAGAPS